MLIGNNDVSQMRQCSCKILSRQRCCYQNGNVVYSLCFLAVLQKGIFGDGQVGGGFGREQVRIAQPTKLVHKHTCAGIALQCQVAAHLTNKVRSA